MCGCFAGSSVNWQGRTLSATRQSVAETAPFSSLPPRICALDLSTHSQRETRQMRCKNCHTVMMDTDLECPSCHASVASATAAPPQPGGGKPNGLLMLLPIFGGALGGLAYAALADTEPGVTRPSTGQASGSGSMRK